MAKNKIQYIIDHPGYGDEFIVTSITNGFQRSVDRNTVSVYSRNYNCLFSVRANVVFNSVTQAEVA